MGIKKLSYPAYGESGPRGIDPRLGDAHIHNNFNILEEITSQDIEDIRNSLDIDLSKLSDTGIATLNNVIESLSYLKSFEGSGAYILSDGSHWEQLSDIQIPVNLSVMPSSSSYVQSSRGYEEEQNYFFIGLTETAINMLEAVSGKASKITDGVVNNVAIIAAGGEFSDSGISKDDILISDDLVTAFSDGSPYKPASAKLTSILKQQVDSIEAGIGRVRGFAYNALVSTGDTNSVNSVSIVNGGYGFEVGDVMGVRLDKLDAEFVVTSTSGGAISSLEVVYGGANSSPLLNQQYELYPKNKTVFDPASLPTVRITTTISSRSTLSDLTSYQDPPVVGDSAYVLEDESHYNARSIWIYKQLGEDYFGWVYAIPIEAQINLYEYAM